MKTSSCKAKGRKFQNDIVSELLKTFQGVLEEDDITSRSMGCQGTDILLSPQAKKYINYSIEAKNQETIKLYDWWEQTVKNTSQDTKPLLILRKNRKPPLVVMDLNEFLDILKSRIQ